MSCVGLWLVIIAFLGPYALVFRCMFSKRQVEINSKFLCPQAFSPLVADADPAACVTAGEKMRTLSTIGM